MKKNKNILILAAALMVLGVLIIYRILNPFTQPTVDKLTFTGKNNTTANDSRVSKKMNISQKDPVISKFLNKKETTGKTFNDLFSIYHPPHKMGKDFKYTKTQTDVSAVQKRPFIKDPAQIKKEQLQKAKDYITSYTLYGNYESENTRAVFLSKDKLVLLARVGDRLDGKYLIKDIQDTYIKFKALDLNETIHLDIREFSDE